MTWMHWHIHLVICTCLSILLTPEMSSGMSLWRSRCDLHAYAMSHWLAVLTYVLLLRPSNHIYAAASLSQSKVHDADRPSQIAELPVVQPAECEWWPQTIRKLATAGSYAVHGARNWEGKEEGTESAQHDKHLDGSRSKTPSTYNTQIHSHKTILRPFLRDLQGEQVPEEIFWTLWCTGRYKRQTHWQSGWASLHPD